MPGGKGNIKPKDGKQFSSENQPANRGRKKKIYNYIKEKGFGSDDIRTVFEEIPFYTQQELTEAANNVSNPWIVKFVASQMSKAIEKNDYTKIKEILEYVLGSPQQNVDLKAKVDNYHIINEFVEPNGENEEDTQ
ncbi:MAG: hypothetical protein K9J21_07275 [Bacteroidales bacterium]|nr:hypothetical protein [Bacteroidales bacterium]